MKSERRKVTEVKELPGQKSMRKRELQVFGNIGRTPREPPPKPNKIKQNKKRVPLKNEKASRNQAL